MNSEFSPEMLRRIDAILVEARATKQAVAVYAEAEKIRTLAPEINIALEDIVEQLIVAGRRHGVAFEIDLAQARDAVMGSAAIGRS